MKKLIFSIMFLAISLSLASCEKNTEERKELHILQESSDMQEWIRNLPSHEGPVYSEEIRGLSVEKDGSEIFTVAYAPEEYKLSFNYWEITSPYTSQATVNTETLYALLGQLDGLEITENDTGNLPEDTGLDDSKTYITIALSSDGQKEEADSVLRLRLGKTDGDGHIYVSDRESSEVGLLEKSIADILLSVDPYDYILKIPVLPDITTVDTVEVEKSGKLYIMSSEDGEYTMDGRKTEEEEYNKAFQNLLNILITGEMQEGEEPDIQEEPVLTVRFFRNTEEASDIEVKYYPYDDSHVAVSVNGETSFLADLDEVENLCGLFF